MEKKVAWDMAVSGAIRQNCELVISFVELAASWPEGVRSELTMVTGDKEPSARIIADEVGITDVHSELLPEDKQRIVRELQAEGAVVAKVVDGAALELAVHAVKELRAGVGTEVIKPTAHRINQAHTPELTAGC